MIVLPVKFSNNSTTNLKNILKSLKMKIKTKMKEYSNLKKLSMQWKNSTWIKL